MPGRGAASRHVDGVAQVVPVSEPGGRRTRRSRPAQAAAPRPGTPRPGYAEPQECLFNCRCAGIKRRNKERPAGHIKKAADPKWVGGDGTAVSALEALLAHSGEKIEIEAGQQERSPVEGGGREQARPEP